VRNAEAPTEKFAAVTAAEKSRIAFIDIGRTVAALVVFYTHIANQFIEARHGGSAVTDGFTALFETPLKLSSEGIGQISIYFFFLVSGFVVTPIALKLGARRFGVNRFFRIYPMNVLAVLLAAGGIALGLSVLSAGHKQDITPGTLLANLTLANFSLKPFWAMVGVAWTLAVEVLFYLLLVAVLPLLRRWVWAAIFVELDVVLILVLLRTPLGPDFGGFASQSAYLLLPIMGQIIWAGWHGKIHRLLAGGYLLAAWGLFVLAANLKLDTDYLLRAGPIVFAVLVFYVGLGTEDRLKQRTFWTAMSERSYSLYLMHGLIALPLMHAISDSLPVWLSVIVGVAATFVVVELAYRLVELPSHNLGRRLSKRTEVTTPTPGVGFFERLLGTFRRRSEDDSSGDEDADDEPRPARRKPDPTHVAPDARTVRRRRPPAEEIRERHAGHLEVPRERPATNGRRTRPDGPRERAAQWTSERSERLNGRPRREPTEQRRQPAPQRRPRPEPPTTEAPPAQPRRTPARRNGRPPVNGRRPSREPEWPSAGDERSQPRPATNHNGRPRRPQGQVNGERNGRRTPPRPVDRRESGPPSRGRHSRH